MNKRVVIIILLIIAAFALSGFFYNQLPAQMASHWNIKGEVNGYMPRFWGSFLMPIIMLVLGLLFWAIPYIDPLRKNIHEFIKQYEILVAIILLFLLAVHAQTLLWNIGMPIPMNTTLPIGIGLLFFFIGVLFQYTKRNWFVGIRTPWTLSSDRVWNKTHKLGSKLFKAAGVTAIIGALFPEHAIWFILAPIIAASITVILYSYLEYRR